MLDFADLVALNKFDKRDALDALRDVQKQFQRNHKLFDNKPEEMPVFGTIASQFNDPGMNKLYVTVMQTIVARTGADLNSNYHASNEMSEKIYVIPPTRTRYLSEISENNRRYDEWAKKQSDIARKLYQLDGAIEQLSSASLD